MTLGHATERVVIHDPEMGIYLGSCLGLGFWSLLDSAGQFEAAGFADLEEAKSYVRTWENGNDPEKYWFSHVRMLGDGDTFLQGISIEELKAAHLGHLLGDMERNRAEWIGEQRQFDLSSKIKAAGARVARWL